MRLIYKGKFTTEDQLQKGTLPPNAVQFKEPDTPAAVNRAAFLVTLPVLVVIVVIVILSATWHNGIIVTFHYSSAFLGILVSFLLAIPHELLHALWFGKGVDVELYIIPKKLMVFVTTTHPVSKKRFIWLSLCPNLIFGWLPFVIWAFMPERSAFSDFLLFFSGNSILMGAGDYINVFNALRQMPKGSVQQLSGFHSYWFMPT